MSIQYLVRSTWSNSRFKKVKLDASTTELGNAFQISKETWPIQTVDVDVVDEVDNLLLGDL